jgi:hypothetical protein
MSEFYWSGLVNDVRTYWMTGERFYMPDLSLESVIIN